MVLIASGKFLSVKKKSDEAVKPAKPLIKSHFQKNNFLNFEDCTLNYLGLLLLFSSLVQMLQSLSTHTFTSTRVVWRILDED